MKNNEINVKDLMVEGFNPDDYKQYYSDGTPYLPIKVQLLWFRMKYPNGKIPVFRPEWTPDKQVNTFMATARVYKDAADPVDNYLSEASAMRGPDVKIAETGESIDPYYAAQIAAMSLALKMAGFWCGLTDDDLTKELEHANAGKSQQNAVTDTAKEQEVPEDTGDKKPGKGKGRGKKDSTKEKTPVEQETPVEQDVSGEAPEETPPAKTPAKEPEDEAPVEEPNTESPDKNEPEQPKTEQEPVTEEDIQAPEDAPVKQDEPGEETVPEETETATEPDVSNTDAPSDESAEEKTEETAEIPEETAEALEQDGTPAEALENVDNTDTPASDEEKEADNPLPVTEEKLSELREMPFSCRYFKGTIGDLERGKLNGEDMETSLVKYLLTSVIAMNKTPEAATAMCELADLIHKDWIKEVTEA